MISPNSPHAREIKRPMFASHKLFSVSLQAWMPYCLILMRSLLVLPSALASWKGRNGDMLPDSSGDLAI